MHSQVPPPKSGEEITIQDVRRQESEWKLTRSNWRFFRAMEQSSDRGTDRRDQSGRKKNV